MAKRYFLTAIASTLVYTAILALSASQSASAEQTQDRIILQKDMPLHAPVLDPSELPDSVTFSIYESKDSTIPLATQTFSRGSYAVDFDLSHSDGISAGPIARLSVIFDAKLSLESAIESLGRPKALWVETALNDIVIGEREGLDDETIVRMLLASDASIASYLTLSYEGDDNPIATIYKSLPLQAGISAKEYVSSLISVGPSMDDPASLVSPYWEINGANEIFYTNGNVGMGTNDPARTLHLKGTTTTLRIDRDSDTAAIQIHRFPTGDFSTPWKGFLLGVNASGSNNGYFMIADYGQAVGGPPTPRMIIASNGNVGIGTTTPSHLLAVNGSGRFKEVIVDTSWSDFVFEPSYQLPDLSEVEAFIAENKHLPGIPSETEVTQDGVGLGTISSKLLQKIEELTLYMIDLKKENAALREEVAVMQIQVDSLQNRVDQSSSRAVPAPR